MSVAVWDYQDYQQSHKCLWQNEIMEATQNTILVTGINQLDHNVCGRVGLYRNTSAHNGASKYQKVTIKHKCVKMTYNVARSTPLDQPILC